MGWRRFTLGVFDEGVRMNAGQQSLHSAQLAVAAGQVEGGAPRPVRVPLGGSSHQQQVHALRVALRCVADRGVQFKTCRNQ